MGQSKAAFGPDLIVYRASAILGGLDVYTAGPLVLCSYANTIRLLCDYTPGGALGAFEFIAQVSPNGSDWYNTTIDNVGALTVLAGGTSSLSDAHVHRFQPHGGKFLEDYAITLAQSTPFIRFLFAEWGNAAPSGTLAVNLMLS